MKRKLLFITIPVVLLVIVYFSGPSPSTPVFNKVMPAVPTEHTALEGYISQQESKHNLKPGNEAQIVWADSTKRKTEYAIVYLHGFSASQMEGDPIHRRFAKEFGCNLYLSRLADHGIDTTEALLGFTADRFWESSKEALSIGKAIGDKVILMSTSTGGTTALMLAAEYPDDVYGLINLSPNIALRDPAAFLLNDPWGLQIARTVMGGNYREWVPDEQRAKYWNSKYRLESLTQLEELVESSMNEKTFAKVKQPSLTLYYYKNDQEQDPEVRVSEMLKMNKLIATPDSLKVIVPIPNAGAHVLGSTLVSKDVESVYQEIEAFAITKLKMVPIEYKSTVDCPMNKKSITSIQHYLTNKDKGELGLKIESSDSSVMSIFEGYAEELGHKEDGDLHIVIRRDVFTYVAYYGLKEIFVKYGEEIKEGTVVGIADENENGGYSVYVVVSKRSNYNSSAETVEPNLYIRCK